MDFREWDYIKIFFGLIHERIPFPKKYFRRCSSSSHFYQDSKLTRRLLPALLSKILEWRPYYTFGSVSFFLSLRLIFQPSKARTLKQKQCAPFFSKCCILLSSSLNFAYC